jgi:EAL domain-containing protein (putative c-di-GMP-specific phosphodiesterase class I)
MSQKTRDPRDVAYEQALVYAREMRELYRSNRATAQDMRAREEAKQRIEGAIDDVEAIGTVFQPIMDLRTRRAVGVEALSRFAPAPVRTPDLWFAEAEQVGLLHELDLRCAGAALGHYGRIPRGAYLSVNLSPSTILSPGFEELVSQTPGNLVLEITEHAPIGDYDVLAGALTAFRRGGGRLAVDDAGSGFASLRHILRLAPDVIKLDVDLTRGIDLDPARRALARALISFAHDIHASIVAEGVETEDELKTLRTLGVLYAQGFYLGRPGPLEERLEVERRARPRQPGP